MRVLAPIVLFVYNRPEHTRRTIEALKANLLANDSTLYIYADAPKESTPDNDLKVRQVRKIIHEIDGFKDIEINERKTNWGLGKNITEGVTSVVNKHGRVIVLEDDIVTSKFFLQFMNDALDRFEYEELVMQISGYTVPMKKKGLPDCFFMSWPDCWGWATWKRSWDKFERDPQKLIDKYSQKDIKYLTINGASPSLWGQVIMNAKGEKYTWAIFFHAMVCEHRGLTLYCKDSLAKNIGNDGSGDNCGQTTEYDVELRVDPIDVIPIDIKACKKAERYYELFFKSINSRNIMKKIIKYLFGVHKKNSRDVQ